VELRRAGLGDFCIGEVGGRAPEGFDFGNSPFEITSVDLQGKRLSSVPAPAHRELCWHPAALSVLRCLARDREC
jgi:hypothetical protein